MKKIILPFGALVFLLSFGLVEAKEKKYVLEIEHAELTVQDKRVDHALTINGQIPGPVLEFTEGDIAVIEVVNKTTETSSMHWHGLLVPWNMDGPMFINNEPILAGESFTFRFPIRQSGTYWYHSHTELQEQRGVYGGLVIRKKNEPQKFDHEEVVVLSDWTNEHPKTVLNNLKKHGHFYNFKKKFFPSLVDAASEGALGDYLSGRWTRMGAMDFSDVGYDEFWINGKPISTYSGNVRPGDRVKLRVINAGASTFFHLNLGNGRHFHVVSKDGQDVVPTHTGEILMGMGETYDIVFKVPENKKIEFRATAQDVTGYASLFFGNGELEYVPDRKKPSKYKMDHGHGDHGRGHDDHGDGHDGGHDDHGDGHDHGDHDGHHGDHSAKEKDHQHHQNQKSSKAQGMTPHRLHYGMLRSPTPTAFSKPPRRIELRLSGDMDRYTWEINGKPLSEEMFIEVHYGEVIRLKFINETMMHHPMHLHGHFFRIINGQGDHAPWAHTADVAPMSKLEVEFHAVEKGTWFLHCHNLYHMKMGMSRLIKYVEHKRPEYLKKSQKKYGSEFIKDSDLFPPSFHLDLYTNHAELELLSKWGSNELQLTLELDEWDLDLENFESQAAIHHYLHRYFAIKGGAEYRHEELEGILGITAFLPGEIDFEGYLTTEGKAVIKLKTEIPLIDRFTLDLMGESRVGKGKPEWEAKAGLMYPLTENLKVGVLYKWEREESHDFEDDHSVGVGFTLEF